MVSKDILTQYADLQQEIKEIRKKIEQLENEIPTLEKRIKEIEDKETVRDTVRGGYGGQQVFVIEGIPVQEYNKKKTNLLSKKLMLNSRKSTLELLEFDLLQKTNEVEEFISSINDSRIRRIINLRFIEGLPWSKVATYIGGGNTEDSIRMAFNRFIEK